MYTYTNICVYIPLICMVVVYIHVRINVSILFYEISLLELD